MTFDHLTYQRNGTASVSLQLELKKGRVYAVTGPNGAGTVTGKSWLAFASSVLFLFLGLSAHLHDTCMLLDACIYT